MLVSQTLFGTVDKVKIAIDRLREFEPPEGYYVAFSGGKDSTVIEHLCRLAGVKYDAHFNLTTVDPPELIYHIREHYPHVQVNRPAKTMWQLIIENGYPPTRLFRYCCKWLKETGGGGRRVVTGIRWEESTKRAKRRMVEACYQDKTRIYINPIIDWTERDVWEFIRHYNLPYCQLYDEGARRIGCIGCPFGGTKGMLEDFARWPKYEQQYLRTFALMLEERKRRGKQSGKWHTEQDVLDWWINGQGEDKSGALPDQTVMFE